MEEANFVKDKDKFKIYILIKIDESLFDTV
jgi:hypothetical protein